MGEPRGKDVSPSLQWFPVVTMLQLAIDMAVGSAPEGFGYTIAATDYIEAWLALTEPGDGTRPGLRDCAPVWQRGTKWTSEHVNSVVTVLG